MVNQVLLPRWLAVTGTRDKRPLVALFVLQRFQGVAGGGDGGIRTLDRPLQAYNGLANRRLQPLGHISGSAGMPDAAVRRKRQIGFTNA